MLDFGQIQVGDEATITHLLSQEDVDTFAALTGDVNPLHLDPAFARKTSFRKPVVYGMLSASFISTMIGTLLPGGGGLWIKQTLEFLHPAHVGDKLHVKARVKQKSPATRILVLDVVISNQHHQKVLVGESTVKALEVNDPEKSMEKEKAKTILIAGGSRGIGAATARRLAAEGHTVIVNFVQATTEAEKVVSDINSTGGRALAFQADVADPGQVSALFQKVEDTIGPVEAVVYCAAPELLFHPFEALKWTSLQRQVDVQLKGAFLCAQAALPKMLEAQYGSFVFIGSIAADSTPPPQQTDYIVAKSALTAMARCLAVEYGPKGIRVNVVAPGMTQTDMIANLPDKARMLTRMQTPLRRLGEPEDVAGVVAFLMSPDASYISGETIRVCGGAMMT